MYENHLFAFKGVWRDSILLRDKALNLPEYSSENKYLDIAEQEKKNM